jgi:hypothetical protein
VKCPVCGNGFRLKHGYERMCAPCWFRLKRRRDANEAPRFDARPDPRLPELKEWRDMVRKLLQLAHPDRHGGSPLATAVTSWLLEQRRRLEG